MSKEADSPSPHRRAAIVLGVVGVLIIGLVVAAFAIAEAAGKVWGGIISKAGTAESSGIHRLPSGSVVLLEGTVVGHLETVQTVTVEGPSSARITLYTGRWVLKDRSSIEALSAHSALIVSGEGPERQVVIQLVRNAKSRVRTGELRLNPSVLGIPVYQPDAMR